MTTEETIQQQITGTPVVLYMKGTPQTPQCGFSAATVQALADCGQKFSFVNILENPDIRSTLPNMFDWPTFPQLYIKGELVGGCDIIVDMHKNGELKPLLVDAWQEDANAAG